MIRNLLCALLFTVLTAVISCKKSPPEPTVETSIARLGKILGQDLLPGTTKFEFLKAESSDPKLIKSIDVDSIEVKVQDLGISVRGIILGDQTAKIFSYYGWQMEGGRLKLGITDVNQELRTVRIYYWLIN